MYKYKETQTIDRLIKKIEDATFLSAFNTSLAKAAIRLSQFTKQEKINVNERYDSRTQF